MTEPPEQNAGSAGGGECQHANEKDRSLRGEENVSGWGIGSRAAMVSFLSCLSGSWKPSQQPRNRSRSGAYPVSCLR